MRETLQHSISRPSHKGVVAQLLEESEACDTLKATKKEYPNPVQLLTILTQAHTEDLTEQEVLPYPGVNTFYFSLYCPTHNVWQSIKKLQDF